MIFLKKIKDQIHGLKTINEPKLQFNPKKISKFKD